MKQPKRAAVNVNLNLDVDELVESLVQGLPFEEIHDFIVKLEKACEDWGVTENLYRYFEGEMKNCPKDEPESA